MPDRLGLQVGGPNALMRIGVKRPGVVFSCWILACLAAIPGIQRLEIDTSTSSVLDRSDPAWQVYQDSQDRFGGDEIVVVSLAGESPYDPGILLEIERLSDLLESVDGVRRVDSIATVPIVRVNSSGELELRSALDGAPADPAERADYVAARLAGDRIAPRSLVSGDGRVFAINLLLERDQEERHAELLREFHTLIDPIGGILSGVPVFRVAANQRTSAEILYFAPITGGLIVLFLFLVFRSLRAVVLGLAPGLLGSWFLLSAMGYLDSPLSITTMVLPSIVLALGCAYSMHVLVAAADAPPVESPTQFASGLAEALERVSLPVALSGLTTAVGFAAITLVRIEAVRATGGFGALGVVAVTLASLTLLPAGLALGTSAAPLPRGRESLRDRVAPALVKTVDRHGRIILATWLLVAGVIGLGLTRIEIETDATKWLPVGNPVRDDYERIRAALSGISPLNVIVETPSGGNILAPGTLRALDGLTAHLDSLSGVGKALSIADPLRQLHGGFMGAGDQPLPSSLELSEQYLLLLESLEQIEDLIAMDRSSANILIRADDNGSTRLLEIGEEAQNWWRKFGPDDSEIVTTGIMYEFARAENEIAYGQLRGLSVALAVIAVVLFWIFRRPRLALLTLIPNGLPLLIIFGILGLSGLPLDAGTVLIGCLALGVAVDDTIHVATAFHFRRGIERSGTEALTSTFSQVLPAITSTTLMISAAFAVIAFSEFTITRNLGLLTAETMLLCLLADITLLPALLLRLPPKKRASP